MAGLVVLPANVNASTTTPALPLGYVYEHKFAGLAHPVQVFQPNLGPEHPGCISIITTGFCREINFWWRQFADHSHVVFTPHSFRSRPPIPADIQNNGGRLPLHFPYYTVRRRDSLSMCGECARTLSIRSCDGTTTKSHSGCDFHQANPQIPFAYRRRDLDPPQASFLSNIKNLLWNHRSQVDMFFLSQYPIKPTSKVHTIIPGAASVPGHPLGGAMVFQSNTLPVVSASSGVPSVIALDPDYHHKPVSLNKVSFLRDFRQVNDRAALPRVRYVHNPNCLHGTDPQCIIQGPGLAGMYYQQCDGSFANALGEPLTGVTGRLSRMQRRQRGERNFRLGGFHRLNTQSGDNNTNTNASGVNNAVLAASSWAINNQPPDFRTDVITVPQPKPSSSPQGSCSSASHSPDPSHPTDPTPSFTKRKRTRPSKFPPTLTPAEVAERAWRTHHPAAGPNTWEEIEAIRKRAAQLEAKEARAQKRREILPKAGLWLGERGKRVAGWMGKVAGVKDRGDGEMARGVGVFGRRVKGRVGEWVWEHRVGFWGA